MVVNPTVKSGSMRDREREYNHWDKGWRWYDSQREYRFSLQVWTNCVSFKAWDICEIHQSFLLKSGVHQSTSSLLPKLKTFPLPDERGPLV